MYCVQETYNNLHYNLHYIFIRYAPVYKIFNVEFSILAMTDIDEVHAGDLPHFTITLDVSRYVFYSVLFNSFLLKIFLYCTFRLEVQVRLV